MTTVSQLDALLSVRPAVLWVEDRLTKEYLQRIWQPDDQLFHFLIAGNHANVTAVVSHLREEGHEHVFGFVDRDFQPSNRARWKHPSANLVIYRPECLEIENFLLDWPALAGCRENRRHQRSRQAIQAHAEQVARQMVWWMACRELLSNFHERLTGTFPDHPKSVHINSLQDAEDYIKTARGWWNNLPGQVAHVQNESAITSGLQSASSRYQDSLNDGTWTEWFSGKEIFRSIRGFLFNQRYAGNDVMDTDLAKSVADWQVDHQAVPAELMELKDSLKERLGL